MGKAILGCIALFGQLLGGAASAEATTPPSEMSRHAIQHEDVWLARRLGPPLLSPNGKLVLLTVTEPAYDPNQAVVDLWLARTDGGAAPRRLTATRAAETGPSFSPDSRQIVFSSQREGDNVAQIYELDLVNGGDAQPLTNLSSGGRSPQYSPDGSQVLFVSAIYPGASNDEQQKAAAAERAARKYKVRVYTGFPVRNWDKWIDETQLRLFVQPRSGGLARDLLAGSKLLENPGYGGRFTETSEELDAVWAPDGRSIVFSATINRDAGAYGFTHNDLYEVAIAGGEPRRLTGGDGLDAADSWTKPRFAPNGKKLYALVEPRTDKVYNANRIGWLKWPDRSTSKLRIGARDGRAVSSFALSPDSRNVYFLSETEGQELLWRSGLRGGFPQRLGDRSSGVLGNLSSAEFARDAMLVANQDSADQLPEIILIDPEDGKFRPLTAFNQQRQKTLDLPPVEHFWSKSPTGKDIHSLLVRPAGFDPNKKYPLIVLLHGGPHGAWRDSFGLRWNYHLIAGRDYVLLLSNFSGSTGFGEAFAQSIQGDPFKGPADEINAAADAAIAEFPFIDGSRQCAAGASYGGHLANWMQGTTTRYRCLVSHAGLINLESQWGSSDTVYSREANSGGPPWELGKVWSEQNPIRLAANFKTPTLVSIGESDFRVPLNNSLEYWSVLQRQKVESRLLVFPDENHWILKGENSRYFYQELHDWFGRWLSDAAAPSP